MAVAHARELSGLNHHKLVYGVLFIILGLDFKPVLELQHPREALIHSPSPLLTSLRETDQATSKSFALQHALSAKLDIALLDCNK